MTQQNTTVQEPTEKLSPKQNAALEALLLGATVTAAADAAGVDRATVHRWLKTDFTFLATYNRERRQLRDASVNRLIQVSELATATLCQAIKDGDLTAAVAVLKGVGLLSCKPVEFGSEDAEELRANSTQKANEVSLLSILSGVTL